MKKKTFALSGDYGYINQIETTVKSILYHHCDAKIYIVNKDIPQEWFSNINNRIRPLNSRIINLKINNSMLESVHVSKWHINEMSYGRIVLPSLVNEKRVLYLDSDIIVDHPLDELFELNMGDYAIAAVPDVSDKFWVKQFNSGVLLFNMTQFKKQPDLVSKMLSASTNDQLMEGDQSVLNYFFGKNYLHLPTKYNLAIGYDILFTYEPTANLYAHEYFKQTQNEKGYILHYTGTYKPWKQFSSGRGRKKYWQYRDLEWSEICSRAPLPKLWDYSETGKALTLTASQDIFHLEELAKALPTVTFNIAAESLMGEQLTNLVKYPNIRLFPAVTVPVIDKLIADADFYLDINCETKLEKYLNRFMKTQKPMLTFDKVSNAVHFKNVPYYHRFADDDVVGMVDKIKNLLTEK